MTIRSRLGAQVDRGSVYQRLFVGDAIFTDDPNDDWFCIHFDKWIGDYCPTDIYICKKTGRTKVMESNLFCTLLHGFFVCDRMLRYQFDHHHKLILEKFARNCFRDFNSRHEDKRMQFSLDKVMITLTRQRV